jgi:signal transduction histidine kinase
MEAGRIDLELGPAQIDKLVLDSFDAVARLAEQKRIKLQYQQCGLKCHVDPDRIMQVIVNLLSNAIKFAPEASQVDVRCQAIDEIAMVEVSVTDRGPGIPTSAQKKIFARFEQVTSSDRTQKGGTGLGLAICKMIVDAHHGTIDVISDPGKGSTFRFRLPAADGELPLPVMQPISQTNET